MGIGLAAAPGLQRHVCDDRRGAEGPPPDWQTFRRRRPRAPGAWASATNFRNRPDGLAGLLKTYGLRLQGTPVTMDLGLLYQALNSGKVDMIAANATDGLISVLPVTILKDDRHYFPPYECAVVVREDTLRRNPQLKEALTELSGRLSDATIRKLNYQVDGEHRPVPEVARSFLH